MAIETLIETLIASLNANTAALKGSSVSAVSGTTTADTAATTKTTGTKGAGKSTTKTATGPTREEMVAALTQVKEQFGAAEAKAIIAEVGADKMAAIADAKIGAAFKLAKAKLDAAEAEANEPEEDDGL